MNWKKIIDQAYVINLSNRPDRLELAKNELDSIGMPFQVYPALSYPFNGAIGIYCTILSLVENAYFSGLNTIAIFEDDVKFINPEYTKRWFNLNWHNFLRFADNVNYDIFYLGCNLHEINDANHPNPITNNNFSGHKYTDLFNGYKVLDAYGCHAMIISRKGMYSILKMLHDERKLNIEQNINHVVASVVLGNGYYNTERYFAPIDVLIAKHIQSKGDCYCADSLLATQMNGFSDIESKIVSQEYILERFYAQVDKLASSK